MSNAIAVNTKIASKNVSDNDAKLMQLLFMIQVLSVDSAFTLMAGCSPKSAYLDVLFILELA